MHCPRTDEITGKAWKTSCRALFTIGSAGSGPAEHGVHSRHEVLIEDAETYPLLSSLPDLAFSWRETDLDHAVERIAGHLRDPAASCLPGAR